MKNLISCRINVMVSDMDEAVRFYTETLDLDLINRYGDHYAEVQAPDLIMGLHPTKNPIQPGNGLSIGLGVVEFDKTIKSLETKGISFKIVQDGWIRLAHFTDPDKNPLFLAEHKE